jgi:hypothetical protein
MGNCDRAQHRANKNEMDGACTWASNIHHHHLFQEAYSDGL